MTSCRRCGRTGATTTNMLGEAVCERCRTAQLGMAAGMLKSNGGANIGEAIVTTKLFGRIRRILGILPKA